MAVRGVDGAVLGSVGGICQQVVVGQHRREDGSGGQRCGDADDDAAPESGPSQRMVDGQYRHRERS